MQYESPTSWVWSNNVTYGSEDWEGGFDPVDQGEGA